MRGAPALAAIFAAAPAQSSLACFLCYVRLKFAIGKESFELYCLASQQLRPAEQTL